MPKKHDNLFGDITGFAALTAAAKRAVKGKRGKSGTGAASFMANLEPEVLRLERDLLAGTYRPGLPPHREFTVTDAKTRQISAAPFRDRMVHHAFCAVVAPLFEAGFVFDSYADRAGKGTHRAVDRFETCRDRFAFVLRGDIFRYFPAIGHAVLKAGYRACAATAWQKYQ